MKLYEILPQKDIELLGNKLEHKDYSKEDMKSLLLSIETDIISCSTKNGDMDKMRNEFSDIMNFLEENI